MKANSKRKVFGDAVDLLMGDMEEVTMPRRSTSSDCCHRVPHLRRLRRRWRMQAYRRNLFTLVQRSF